MSISPAAIKLNQRFSAKKLTADLRSVAESSRIRKHRTASGIWSGLALRSTGGVYSSTFKASGSSRCRYTPIIRKTPYIKQILEGFGCPLYTVHLMFLSPGAFTALHVDRDVDLRKGRIRLHVPIVTNQDAYLVIDKKRFNMRPGELWYADFRRPHYACNFGHSVRAHLVIDLALTRKLLGLFPRRVSREILAAGAQLHVSSRGHMGNSVI